MVFFDWIVYHTVLNCHTFQSKNTIQSVTVTQSNQKNTTLSEQLHNLIKKYHTVSNCYTIQSKNTTLSVFLHIGIEKYHIVRTVTQFNRKIPHCQYSYTIQSKNTTLSVTVTDNPMVKYHTVRTVTQSNGKNTTLSVTVTDNPMVKYHIVRTVGQSNRKIPHCQNCYTIQSKNTTLSVQFTQSNRKIPHCQ